MTVGEMTDKLLKTVSELLESEDESIRVQAVQLGLAVLIQTQPE